MSLATLRPVTGAVTLVVTACLAATASAQQGPSPVRLDADKMAGLDLISTGGGAYEDILVEGELKFRVATLFAGEELRVSVFESTPATTDHRTRPLDVDEFVLVLSGKLILTEQDGTRHEFTPGQTVVLPRGCRAPAHGVLWSMEADGSSA